MENEGNGHEVAFAPGGDFNYLAKDLSGFDKKIGDATYKTTIRDSFATLTYFVSREQATAWVDLIMRAYNRSRWKEYEKLVMLAHSWVGVEGRGRDDVLKAIAQLYWVKDQNEKDKARPKEATKQYV